MISIVTACMNRDAHLRRTLPVWLQLPEVSEIIIVDWTNRTPLRSLGELDPRIRVIRAQGEARWILSYAYNLGVSHARNELILKCDADCLPSPSVTRLRPDDAAFYAGYWKSGAAVGKPSVNGQCFFTRAQFDQVNGYSELIRMYGRDDEDFYDRLIAAGYRRAEIPPAELSFVEHTQEERLVNQIGARPSDPVEALLQRHPAYFEMYNAALARVLPWGRWQLRAGYSILEEGLNYLDCVRDVSREIPVSPPIHSLARTHALRSVTAQACELPPARASVMDEAACLAALRSKFFPAAASRPTGKAPVSPHRPSPRSEHSSSLS